MHKYLSKIKYILMIFFVIFIAAGCSKKPKPEEIGHAKLLEKGLHELKVGSPQRAALYLQTLKDRYPYTESAVIASLKLADIYFDMDEYATAYDLYDEFERYHPKDDNIPYIKYQKAMSHFVQIKSFDRDQSHVQKAKEEFEKLINQFPDNEYSVMARRHLRVCLFKLARFEMYTGNFYFNQKMYASAIQRYKYAINNYPDVGQYYEALDKINLSYLKMAEYNKKVKEKIQKKRKKKNLTQN